jgi:hypothetical protein
LVLLVGFSKCASNTPTDFLPIEFKQSWLMMAIASVTATTVLQCAIRSSAHSAAVDVPSNDVWLLTPNLTKVANFKHIWPREPDQV